jgi:UDP-N-acetylglucosamine transferase subunit ALG13
VIFVIFGTERFPFDRLACEVESMKINNIIQDDVFMQLGSCTYEPKHCAWERYLSFDKMMENISRAQFVIAHAGAGTTLLCLHLEKKPIIVTRQKKYGEHLDNHQMPFGKMMERLNYAYVAYDVDDLKNCFNKAGTELLMHRPPDYNNTELVQFLDSYIEM